jgi:hypothetical protein
VDPFHAQLQLLSTSVAQQDKAALKALADSATAIAGNLHKQHHRGAWLNRAEQVLAIFDFTDAMERELAHLAHRFPTETKAAGQRLKGMRSALKNRPRPELDTPVAIAGLFRDVARVLTPEDDDEALAVDIMATSTKAAGDNAKLHRLLTEEGAPPFAGATCPGRLWL